MEYVLTKEQWKPEAKISIYYGLSVVVRFVWRWLKGALRAVWTVVFVPPPEQERIDAARLKVIQKMGGGF